MELSYIDLNKRPPRAYKRLSNEEKQRIIFRLAEYIRCGKLQHGCLRGIGEEFSVSFKTISKIWHKVGEKMCDGLLVDINEISPPLSGRVGRKKIQVDASQIAAVPLSKRKTIWSLAAAIKRSKSTVHRWFKGGQLKRNSNAIKPSLTEANKKTRLEFCISKLNPHTINDSPMFEGMYDVVHIDEKWFYMSKTTERYYLLPEEIEPHRTCQSKKFITKVMFLAAVARPRFDVYTNEMFSGKIGIFPFVYKEPAKRRSKNRAAGTMETKTMTCVNRDAIRKCLIENVLPAIREKWPKSSSKVIYIQQDNAKPHIYVDDPEFLAAATKDDFLISLSCQPPNSPDLNVLDLGFFNAIQSLQYQESPKTVDELVAAVERSFNALAPESLNKVFLTLQVVMNEVIKCLGENNYSLKHINKAKLERERCLLECMPCDSDALNTARVFLQNSQG